MATTGVAAPSPAWAGPDLGRAWQEAERVLPAGYELSVARRLDGRYLATASNGSLRQWAAAATPDVALEELAGKLDPAVPESEARVLDGNR